MADGPDNTNRLRAVCALLDACGGYFNRGQAKRQLDIFLVYLQRYLFCKALTADVDFIIGDTLGMLRPAMRRAASYAEACELVGRLEAALREDRKAGEALAHELLHGEGGGGTAAEEDDEADDEGARGAEDDDGDDGEGGGEGDGGDDFDAEVRHAPPSSKLAPPRSPPPLQARPPSPPRVPRPRLHPAASCCAARGRREAACGAQRGGRRR